MMKRVFFFGAGASLEAGVPMASQLTERIIGADIGSLRFAHYTEPGAARLAQNFVRELASHPDANFSTGNIEELLNLAAAATELRLPLPFAGRLVEGSWGVDSIIWLTVLLLEDAATISETYTSFASLLSESDVIITLNYDTVCERLLRSRFPGYDYGLGEPVEVRTNRPTELVTQGEHQNQWIIRESPEPPQKSAVPVDDGIPLLKLHGSLNWRRCTSDESEGGCGRLFVYECDFPAFGYTSTTVCECGNGGLKPIIVPPTFVKDNDTEAIRNVWTEALRALFDADELVIVGYSMPAYDVMIQELFRLVSLHRPETRIRIVNPDAGNQAQFGFLPADRCEFIQATFGRYVQELQDAV